MRWLGNCWSSKMTRTGKVSLCNRTSSCSHVSPKDHERKVYTVGHRISSKYLPAVRGKERKILFYKNADLTEKYLGQWRVKKTAAHFWLNGYVNKQNCRFWSEANPQVYVETPLHPEKLTVWCALWAGGILLQKR
ncbi:hypothetical protein TNCV_143011 [Trichonephila clavipes]|nr:hypothetical protein TNCV_143011 [Trichonephila clavipes]